MRGDREWCVGNWGGPSLKGAKSLHHVHLVLKRGGTGEAWPQRSQLVNTAQLVTVELLSDPL